MRKILFLLFTLILAASCGIKDAPVGGYWPFCYQDQWSYFCEGTHPCGCSTTGTKKIASPVCASSTVEAETVWKSQRPLITNWVGPVNCAQGMRGGIPRPPPGAMMNATNPGFTITPAGPMLMPPGPLPLGTCTAADGNACTACAVEACCDSYAACTSDAECQCWVTCEAAGTDVPTCGDKCGAPNAVVETIAGCLSTSCAAACPSTSDDGSAACASCSGASSSSSGSGCVPGPIGAGQLCFSDADCEHCRCNAATGTCD